MFNKVQDVSISPAYASGSEAATYLRISRAMISKLVESGEIPVRRFGRSIRIPWSFLKENAPAPSKVRA